jgi:hypothetical protein
MRHDKQYRRVLKSQDYFLQKYKFVGVLLFFGYYALEILKDKRTKTSNRKLKEELSRLEEADEDLSIIF